MTRIVCHCNHDDKAQRRSYFKPQPRTLLHNQTEPCHITKDLSYSFHSDILLLICGRLFLLPPLGALFREMLPSVVSHSATDLHHRSGESLGSNKHVEFSTRNPREISFYIFLNPSCLHPCLLASCLLPFPCRRVAAFLGPLADFTCPSAGRRIVAQDKQTNKTGATRRSKNPSARF